MKRQNLNGLFQSSPHLCTFVLSAQIGAVAVIHNGFLKCCISNALDSSDDDAVWQDQQSASDAEEDDDGDVYYDGALNDVNLATI